MIIKKGDVVLFSKQGIWIHKAISKITKSDYVHVGIVYSVNKKTDEVVIAEALNQGFIKNTHSYKYLINNINDKFYLMRSNHMMLNIESCIDKYLGISYGKMNLIRIALKIYLGIEFGSDGLKHLICSEAVARCLYDITSKKINLEIEYSTDYDYITPAMIGGSVQLYFVK